MSVTMHKPVHKLISRGGAVMWLPTSCFAGKFSLAVPDIYTQDSVQQYPLGSKLEFADGRVFRYGKFGATTTRPQVGYPLMVNANAAPSCDGYVGDDGFEGNLYAAAAVGDTYVDLWTIIAASGTGYRTTAFAENFFEDGMLAVYPSSGVAEYRIVGNDASTEVSATADYTRCYLEEPLKVALTIGTAGAYVTTGTLTGASGGTGVTAYPSIYSQMKIYGAEGANYTTVVGVPLTTVCTSGYYGWVQRRGRCIVGPTTYFGDSADERSAEPHTAGSGEMKLRASYATQFIGCLTQRTVSGYGDLEIWLQLE